MINYVVAAAVSVAAEFNMVCVLSGRKLEQLKLRFCPIWRFAVRRLWFCLSASPWDET